MNRRVLHVGCGKQPVNEYFGGWEEVRLDIDPSCSPDVVASLTDMGDIGEFDAVYGSHVLEHFAADEVGKVLSECYRVLKRGGLCMMIVPNLEHVRPTLEVVYESTAGPITGLDMYYGKTDMVVDNPFMAHKTGFVPETMNRAMSGVFEKVQTRELTHYNLLGIGVKWPQE
jgi:predicted SAM-dependent methyltransferase